MNETTTRTATTADRQHLSGLLRSLAAGDRPALAELYRRTSAKLYGVCLRLLADEGEAQDVLQDVYLTVWRRAASFDPAKSSPITWLCVVARNKAIDRLRSPRPKLAGVEEAAGVSDERPGAVEIIEQRQQASRLADCLERLDEAPRKAIREAFFAGATYSDLAKRDSVPLGTMKSWIRRALLRLRECLES